MSDGKDYVVDASVIVLALTGRTDTAEALRVRLPTLRCHASHLVDVDVGNVLRRHERDGRITVAEADAAVRVAAALVSHRYSHVGALAQHAWTLRHILSFYDALYVALAGVLDVPLLTLDTRLSRAPGLPCRTELV